MRARAMLGYSKRRVNLCWHEPAPGQPGYLDARAGGDVVIEELDRI